MEDILAVIVVLVLIVAFSFGLKAILRGIAEKKAEQKRKQEESDKFWAAERERKFARMESATLNTPPKKRTFVKREEPAPSTSYSYTPEPVQSTRSVLDDVAGIAMIANTVRHWNDKPHMTNTDNPIDFPKEERSVGVSKSESSWGFDDSDSRKSVSDSFSSSYSSSSDSSSDSFSSSASSDW